MKLNKKNSIKVIIFFLFVLFIINLIINTNKTINTINTGDINNIQKTENTGLKITEIFDYVFLGGLAIIMIITFLTGIMSGILDIFKFITEEESETKKEPKTKEKNIKFNKINRFEIMDI